MKVGEYLVIADVHIGITKDMYDSGVLVPRQSGTLAGRVNKLMKMARVKKLILLGDVKHKVHGFSLREKYELEKFIEILESKETIIVKGNHDGDIEKMVPKGRVKVKKSFVVGDYFFTHGHRNIRTKKKIIVIGHNQPHVKFRDDMKAVYFEPVWIKGRLSDGKKLIMMPAFNELCGATVVNKDRLLGPIAKQLNKRTAHVYLLDGTDLGTLDGLGVKE